jgi:hypothetical protein
MVSGRPGLESREDIPCRTGAAVLIQESPLACKENRIGERGVVTREW